MSLRRNKDRQDKSAPDEKGAVSHLSRKKRGEDGAPVGFCSAIGLQKQKQEQEQVPHSTKKGLNGPPGLSRKKRGEGGAPGAPGMVPVLTLRPARILARS